MKWYENWFDSKYYHTLYKHRNHNEAEKFINNIILKLNIKKDQKIIDVCCGKGRHANYLSKLKFDITGIDLSKNNIEFAKKNNLNNLNFFVHDMRSVFKKNHFDIVINLFTSLGYFDKLEDEEKAINSMINNLKNEGVIIIDFLNVKKTITDLVSKENKIIDNICFSLSRKVNKDYIIKNIKITDQKKSLYFCEKVRLLTLNNFKIMLKKSNAKIIDLYGDYSLNSFDEDKSNRLIIVAKKIK